MAGKPKIAAAMLTWNAEKDIKDTISCIKKQTYPISEIVIVDNGSTDNTLQILKRELPKARIFALKKNTGICRGFNIAFSKVSKKMKYVVVIDQDIVLPADYVKTVVSKFEQEPDNTAILMCDLEEPIIKTFALNEGYIKYFHGACYSFRNKYNEVMRFTEEFFGYGNESDLSARLLKKGLMIKFYPGCKVFHKKTLTKRTNFQTFYMTRNSLWFWWRNAHLKDAIPASFAEILFGYSKSSRSRTLPQFFNGLMHAFLGIPFCLRTRNPVDQISYKDQQDLKFFENRLRS